MNAVHRHCPEQFTFAGADTLDGREDGKKWDDIANKLKPDIIVFNVGPHIHNIERWKEVLQSVPEGKQRLNKDTILIWKTISGPGFNLSLGIMDEFPRLTSNESMVEMAGLQYHQAWTWSNFQTFDLMAKDFFNDTDVHIMDVDPLWMRQDNHNALDMHCCGGGKSALRLVPRLLQTLMEQVDAL